MPQSKENNCTCEKDKKDIEENYEEYYDSFFNLHGSCYWCYFIGE